MEYFTDRMNWSRVHKLRNKDGWYVSDSLTDERNRNDSLIEPLYLFSPQKRRQYFVLYRSTDTEKSLFAKIDSIQCQKKDGVVNPSFGLVVWPLMMISTPIWNYDDEGHYMWETLGILAGLTAFEYSMLMINKYYVKWRTYDLKIYKIHKLKPLPT
jgi:hypothetical protein